MGAAAVGDPIWRAEGAEKRAAVRRMFSDIAPTYDLINSILSLRRHHRWRAQAVEALQLAPGNNALDVCCGTGDFAAPLRRAVGDDGLVACLDFCLPMLEVARTKPASRGAGWLLGDACVLPVASGRLDGVTVGWGIRNVADLDAALMEIARVLRPGGRFVCLDMAVPPNPIVRAGSHLFCHWLVPTVGSLFRKRLAYTYLPKSTLTFATRDALADALRRAGFADVCYRDFMLGNICMHLGVKK